MQPISGSIVSKNFKLDWFSKKISNNQYSLVDEICTSSSILSGQKGMLKKVYADWNA